MTLTESLISGIVQGLTEFLPVSSSGHLVLLHRFFGLSEPMMFFDVCLHAGTLAAVLFYFRKDLLGIVTRRDYRTIALLGAGTVPVVAAGLLFEDRIEALFASPGIVSMMLYGTAFLLLAGEYLYKRVRRMNGLTAVSALGVGAAQAMALVPGISRSGATISAGLAFGLERDKAFSFSFLLSVPAVSAALVYKLLKAGTAAADPSVGLNYAAGAFTAFVVGMASLAVLRRVVASGKLYIFAVYCILAGTVGILYL